MQNKANFRKSQMFITVVLITNYNEKTKLDTWSKRTQTKPILPASAGKIAPLFRMSFILMGLPTDRLKNNSVNRCLSVSKFLFAFWDCISLRNLRLKICVIHGSERHRIREHGLEVDVIRDTGSPATPRKAHTKRKLQPQHRRGPTLLLRRP